MTHQEKQQLLERPSTLSFLRVQAEIHLDPRLRKTWDAGDMVQETLAKAIVSLEQFRGELEPEFLGWLKAILINVHLHALRAGGAAKRDRNREVPMDVLQQSSARLEAVLIAEQSSPSERAVSREIELRIAQFLDGLPEPRRRAVIDSYFHNRSNAEIAAELGVDAGTISRWLTKALEGLRPILEEFGG